MDLNTVGTISLTKAILPHMIKRREGEVVIVSSVLGKFGNCYVFLTEAHKLFMLVYDFIEIRATQCQFSENICSEDDLRSRIFGPFVVKFVACLPFLGFLKTSKKMV